MSKEESLKIFVGDSPCIKQNIATLLLMYFCLKIKNSPGIGIADEVTICVAPGCGSTLVLDSTQLEGCLTAAVQDDNIVDDPESFTISLSTTQPRVDVENMVTFEVIDNDGRSLV